MPGTQGQTSGIAERRSACGRTLAIVIAAGEGALEEAPNPFGDGTLSAVNATVDAVCWAQTAFVFVVASPGVSETVTRQVHLAKRSKHAPVVQVVECDEEAIAPILDASSREIIDALIEACPVECDAALILKAELPTMTGEEAWECCRSAKTVDSRALYLPA